MSRSRRAVRFLSVAVAASVLAARAGAMWSMPSDAPVGRLIVNTTRYIAEHPADPEGYYVLGRVHGLAFTMQSRILNVWSLDGDPRWRKDGLTKAVPDLCDDSFQWQARDWAAKNPDQRLTKPEMVRHLREAVANLAKAIALDPKPALPHLGLAYVLEQGAALAGDCDVLPAPEAQLSEADRKEITALIARLGDNDEGRREKAAAALRARLSDAAGPLLEHREDKDSRVRDGVRRLLTTLWQRAAAAEYLGAY